MMHVIPESPLLMKPVIHDHMSLDELFAALSGNDEGDYDLTIEELERLRGLLLNKVDGCRYVLDDWKAEAARHAAYVQEHMDRKRKLDRKVEKREKDIILAMRSQKFERIQGNEFAFKLKRSERTIIESEANETLFNQYPDLIRKKESVDYSWDKAAVKVVVEAKACPADIKAKVEENFNLHGDVAKKGKYK